MEKQFSQKIKIYAIWGYPEVIFFHRNMTTDIMLIYTKNASKHNDPLSAGYKSINTNMPITIESTIIRLNFLDFHLLQHILDLI